jgi:protein-S-isoprenylcysteine O-methyltransferase Ste14
MLDFMICLLGFLIIVCHTWSLKYHFEMPQVPSGVKVISFLVLSSGVFLTYLLFSRQQGVFQQILGLLLLMMSFVLFWITIRASSEARLLAAFDEKKPRTLLQTGPYSYVRHPFYSSYILQWAGWAIGAWDIWALLPVAGMTTTYWIAANDEEAKFAKTAMAEDYRRYAARTGRFLPKMRFPAPR